MGTSAIDPGVDQFVITPDLSYLPQGFENFYKQAYTYPLEFPDLLRSTSGQDNIAIDAATYFVCTQMNATVSDAATGLTVTAIDEAPILVELKDSASSTLFQNNFVRISNLCGTGERPGYWDRRGLIFRPSSNIVVTVQNIDTGKDYRVEFAFKGFQIYQLPDQLSF